MKNKKIISDKINWMNVTREDVIKAIEIFHREKKTYPSPRNTFLIYNGESLPAKHIRGMAYEVAYGKKISKKDYYGGMDTVQFFQRLGFEIKYTNIAIEKPHYQIKISSKGVIEQKNALQLLLNKLFNGDIVCEKTFPWLKTPDIIDGEYKNLYKSLCEYKGDKSFARKSVKLRCDFVCESKKLIIEYDERQHFSEARKRALESYPVDIHLNFDKQLWIKACNDINSKYAHLFNRDEVRAYYDSARDIESAKNGYKLVRIMHGQIDFESDEAEEKLQELLQY